MVREHIFLIIVLNSFSSIFGKHYKVHFKKAFWRIFFKNSKSNITILHKIVTFFLHGKFFLTVVTFNVFNS